MGERSEVRVTPPSGAGNGTTRRWTRVLGGKRYSFVAVTMPDGELRYFASVWTGRLTPEGEIDGPNFANEWRRVLAWTCRVKRTVQAEVVMSHSFPGRDGSTVTVDHGEGYSMATASVWVSGVDGYFSERRIVLVARSAQGAPVEAHEFPLWDES